MNKILQLYMNQGSAEETINNLKESGVPLEEFFNKIQTLKLQHNDTLSIGDIYTSSDFTAFQSDGTLQPNTNGYRVRINYTYLCEEGKEQMGFLLF